MCFFSVIIPVYNVEKYLDECIKSVLEQGFDSFEIILVDDGSRDNSPEICEKYKRTDGRIKVIHKENGGLSDARNLGMLNSSGRYLIFLDSDDIIFPDSLETIYSSLEKAGFPDVISTNVTEISSADYVPKKGEIALVSADYPEFIRDEMKNDYDIWPAVKRIVSREFCMQKSLSFMQGYLHEDLLWTTLLLANAKKYAVIRNFEWYGYRKTNSSSITHKTDCRRITHPLALINIAKESEAIKSLDEESKKAVMQRLSESTFSSVRHYYKMDDENKKKALEEMQKNIGIYSLSSKPHHKAFYLAAKTFGFPLALKMFKLFIEM